LIDETREVPGDLWIGRPVAGNGGCYDLRLTEFVDLHHPGHDSTARGLPDEAAREDACQQQVAKSYQAPVLCLRASRADAFVPNLSGALIRRLW
jgi:hypothetical protein